MLSSLLMLTMLFSISSKRSMAYLRTSHSVQSLSERSFQRTQVLELIAASVVDLDSGDIIMPAPYDTLEIRLQRVAGLIDLNTAAAPYIQNIITALAFPDDAMQRYSEWRSAGKSFKTTDQFMSVLKGDPGLRSALQLIATVYSGRSDIAGSDAPEEVLALGLTLIANTVRQGDDSSNIAVYVSEAGQDSEEYWGTIQSTPPGQGSGILEVR